MQAIKTPELVGEGCLPASGTSSRSSTQDGMSQETNWSHTFFLSWVVWPHLRTERKTIPFISRVD